MFGLLPWTSAVGSGGGGSSKIATAPENGAGNAHVFSGSQSRRRLDAMPRSTGSAPLAASASVAVTGSAKRKREQEEIGDGVIGKEEQEKKSKGKGKEEDMNSGNNLGGIKKSKSRNKEKSKATEKDNAILTTEENDDTKRPTTSISRDDEVVIAHSASASSSCLSDSASLLKPTTKNGRIATSGKEEGAGRLPASSPPAAIAMTTISSPPAQTATMSIATATDVDTASSSGPAHLTQTSPTIQSSEAAKDAASGVSSANTADMSPSTSAAQMIQLPADGTLIQTGNAASSRSPASLTPGNTAALIQAIDSQISLEILLKHDELRKIDQEIAKCQIALEQLRRCHEIPYPALSGPSLDVSHGTGFVVPSSRRIQPTSPAPWGVMNGPYTRHYAKWLLPDPRFDGTDTEPIDYSAPVAAAAGTRRTSLSGKALPTTARGRATRGSKGEATATAMIPAITTSSTRSQRGSYGSKLQALSSGYPAPKRHNDGPMTIRRSSDNHWVKLICLDCRRWDFSSVQGFINHCRIAHGRGFASHDAAALAAGEECECDETGAIIGSDDKAPDATGVAVAQRGSEARFSGYGVGLVHPMVRSAHLIDKEGLPKTTSLRRTSSTSTATGKRESITSTVSVETPQSSASVTPNPHPVPTFPASQSKRQRPAPTPPNPSFTSSPATPSLSALLQSQGSSLDLHTLVGDAKAKVDFTQYSEDEDGDDEDEEMRNPPQPETIARSRLPARPSPASTMSPALTSIALEKTAVPAAPPAVSAAALGVHVIARGATPSRSRAKPKAKPETMTNIQVSRPPVTANSLSGYRPKEPLTPVMEASSAVMNQQQDEVTSTQPDEQFSPGSVSGNQAPSLVTDSDADDDDDDVSVSDSASGSDAEADGSYDEDEDSEDEDKESSGRQTDDDADSEVDATRSAFTEESEAKSTVSSANSLEEDFGDSEHTLGPVPTRKSASKASAPQTRSALAQQKVQIPMKQTRKRRHADSVAPESKITSDPPASSKKRKNQTDSVTIHDVDSHGDEEFEALRIAHVKIDSKGRGRAARSKGAKGPIVGGVGRVKRVR